MFKHEKDGGACRRPWTEGGPTVKPKSPEAAVAAGPARDGLKDAPPPPGWTRPVPDTRQLDSAQRLIDRVSNDPAMVVGQDIHQLLELGIDPQLSDSVAAALERALSKNASLAEVVVTACRARLDLTAATTSPVRGVIVRLFIAAVGATPEGTQHRTALIHRIETAGLTDSERIEVAVGTGSVSKESIAFLRKQLPLPGWFDRFFGERESTSSWRGGLITEKMGLISSLAQNGLLLDEVVSLVGYPNVRQEVILKGLRQFVTQTSSSLPDATQKALWDLVQSPRLDDSSKFIVEEILLAGTVSEVIQKDLAKRLVQIKDTVPLRKNEDKWVVRMCSQLTRREECIKELGDVFVAAKNSWPIGSQLTGTDDFLSGRVCNEPYPRTSCTAI